MKLLTLSILIFAFPAFIQAGEKIDQTLDVSATADISIEDPNARIDIRGWDKNRIKVSGELSDQAKEYSFEKHGNNVVFEVEYENKMDWSERKRGKDISKLTFHVPVRSRMEVENINGDIDVKGIEGGTSIESINGNVTVENVKQKISLETINGSVTTTNVDGKLNIETINGNITDSHSAGEMNVSTVQGNVSSDSRYSIVEVEIVNGDVSLQLDEVDELNIDSVNSTVEAAMHLNKKGEVSVTNVNGNVDLKFNKNVSADFKIDAFVGGEIINKLTADKADRQKFGPGSSMHFSKDGGSARVSVDTVSGKVQIGPR